LRTISGAASAVAKGWSNSRMEGQGVEGRLTPSNEVSQEWRIKGLRDG